MSIVQELRSADPPPLEPGDRLTADEFERRYEAMPDGTKAELIEGIVYMQAAAKLSHGRPFGLMSTWIGNYSIATPGTEYALDATDRLDDSNQPQPDIALFIDSESGGQTTISDDGYLTGGAELVVEIAGSSVAIDRGPKLRTYERHGVREYLIYRVAKQTIEWYVRRENSLVLVRPDDDGVHRSEVFPGLWLDVAAALKRDGVATMATLDKGINSDSHAAFVKSLQRPNV